MSNIIKFPDMKPETHSFQKIPSSIRIMAQHVMTRLNIQNNANLIHILGNGTEKSNQEAIITWFNNNYGTDSYEILPMIIDVITDKIEKELTDPSLF